MSKYGTAASQLKRLHGLVGSHIRELDKSLGRINGVYSKHSRRAGVSEDMQTNDIIYQLVRGIGGASSGALPETLTTALHIRSRSGSASRGQLVADLAKLLNKSSKRYL